MNTSRWTALGFVGTTSLGLAASIASVVDDLRPSATFCAEAGCEIVRSSAWARPFGVPVSVLGVGFFGAMLVLGAANRPRAARVLALLGAAFAVWLVALQALVIGQWCKLCLVADTMAFAQAAFVLFTPAATNGSRRVFAWAVPAVAAGTSALLWWARPAEAPPLPSAEVARAVVEQASVPGAVTIVEFVDFECPFCRRLHDQLERARAEASQPVQVVRKMVPLDKHKGAMPAAVAWCCADAQGKGETMADALFSADPADLTAEGCATIAEQIGCDMALYREHQSEAELRVARDVEEARVAGIRSLPTLFIGGERFVGATATGEELRLAIDRAAM
ncbi:MAG: thioredoxin domain-containing protein [Polyangiaceae bacterium]|nr:thioredoxin domain-containing protein [Polyangiaceae bacterium]